MPLRLEPASLASTDVKTDSATPANAAGNANGNGAGMLARLLCTVEYEMSLPPLCEHHHNVAYAPVDLPIRAPLLRVVALPVCSAPGLRMRSPYRRTCTVAQPSPTRASSPAVKGKIWTSCSAPDLGCDTRRGKRESPHTVAPLWPRRIVDVCAFEGQRDRRQRRVDMDGDVLLLRAAPPAGVIPHRGGDTTGTRMQEEDGGEWVPGHNRPSSRRIDLCLFDRNGIHIDIRRSDAGSDGRTGAVLPSLAPTHICTRPSLLCGPFWPRAFPKGDSGFWVPILANPDIVEHYSENVIDTFHKNLLLLGEDRCLTTLMLKTFPKCKNMFCLQAVCKTVVPDTFRVLLSQRRRWINSTIHNLMELFVVGMELAGTLVLPTTISFSLYLIIESIMLHHASTNVSLILLAFVLGLPLVMIVITSCNWEYVGWMLIYLLSLPIWNGAKDAMGGDVEGDEGEFDSMHIVMKRWAEFERERWKSGHRVEIRTKIITESQSSGPQQPVLAREQLLNILIEDSGAGIT
ncbi:chitin synthase-domain-containing protein [Mycena galopus ATCC 62051]|nr:chitin synthase-domain-containing protein [Mycena galopus ATCC 62051]